MNRAIDIGAESSGGWTARACPRCLFPGGLLLVTALAGCLHSRPAAPPGQSSGSPFRRTLELDGLAVHYLDTGARDGAGTLLIVHGFLGSSFPFRKLAGSLDEELRVVVPDLPGFGGSQPPAAALGLEYYQRFLERFTQRLGLERFVLLGTSMGANIGTHYACAHPGQVRALVLLSPFGLQDQGGRMTQIERWDPWLPLASSLVSRRRVARTVRRTVQREEVLSPDLLDSFWRPFSTREGRKVLVEVTRNLVGCVAMDDVLPQVGQPLLVLVGDRDELIDGATRARLRRLLPEGSLQVVEGCGHFLYLEDPGLVSDRILKFVNGGS